MYLITVDGKSAFIHQHSQQGLVTHSFINTASKVWLHIHSSTQPARFGYTFIHQHSQQGLVTHSFINTASKVW